MVASSMGFVFNPGDTVDKGGCYVFKNLVADRPSLRPFLGREEEGNVPIISGGR